MSNYDEKAKLREALEVGFPRSMFAALTGTYPKSASVVGLGQGNGVAANVDQGIPVAASGTQEKAPGVVNLGRDGPEHDFKAAASALPHDGNGSAIHKDDCRYWKSGDFCTCGAAGSGALGDGEGVTPPQTQGGAE